MSQEALDQPATIRSGEELDEKILAKYLQDKIDIAGEISILQFPSGFSNLTYFIQSKEKEYVLRKPPHGANIKSAHDMGREFKVLSLLKPVYPYVPEPILYEEDPSILGGPFYLMERVKGVILRNRAPKGVDLTPALMKSISEKAIDHLAALHRLDLDNGLKDFGNPEGYNQRQVSGWIKRYFNAETDAIPMMNKAAEWLTSNVPDKNIAAFIHNDYKYDNLVLNPSNLADITAVLDWEMATIGDPLMDLGTTLGYWGEPDDSEALKPFNLTWLPGNLNREEVALRYAQQANQDMGNLVFYYVFGSFKIGVIVQQIYARYKKGLTKDPRFAALLYVVKACAQNASNAIKFNRISNFK